jgi:hypothetical protein
VKDVARGAFRLFKGLTPPERLGVLFLFAMGAALRLWGIATPFNLHEADQARIVCFADSLPEIFEGPGGMRPALFQLLTWGLAQVQCAEWLLRLLPFFSSLLLLPALFWLLRQLDEKAGDGRAFPGFLMVAAIWATHPVLIGHAKVMKPYSTEALMAVFFVAAAISLRRVCAPGLFRVVLMAAPLSVLVGHPMVFVLPFFGLALFSQQVAQKKWRNLTFTALSLSLAALFFFAQMQWVVGKGVRGSFDYWGDRFHAPAIQWGPLGHQVLEILGQMPLSMPQIKSPGTLELAVLVIIALVTVVGAIRLSLKDGGFPAVLLTGPLFLPLVASVADRWPFGLVRVNTFMVPLCMVLFVFGLGALTKGALFKKAPPALLSGAFALLILLVALALNFSGYKRLPHGQDLKPAIDHWLNASLPPELLAQTGGKEPRVFMRPMAKTVFELYRDLEGPAADSPMARQEARLLGKGHFVELLGDEKAIKKTILEKLPEGQAAFFVYSIWGDRPMRKALGQLEESGQLQVVVDPPLFKARSLLAKRPGATP